MPTGTCENCKWFAPDTETAISGYCHRWPPVMLQYADAATGSYAMESAYPHIRKNNGWCGEWAAGDDQ